MGQQLQLGGRTGSSSCKAFFLRSTTVGGVTLYDLSAPG
jgi:hypothetical protein